MSYPDPVDSDQDAVNQHMAHRIIDLHGLIGGSGSLMTATVTAVTGATVDVDLDASLATTGGSVTSLASVVCFRSYLKPTVGDVVVIALLGAEYTDGVITTDATPIAFDATGDPYDARDIACDDPT